VANVIIMRVPKDKLQQEIEYKVLDGWKLRKKNENIAVLTRRGEWENLLIYVALALLTLESLYIVYHWIKGKKELQSLKGNHSTSYSEENQ
jgi:hypothetical protein